MGCEKNRITNARSRMHANRDSAAGVTFHQGSKYKNVKKAKVMFRDHGVR